MDFNKLTTVFKANKEIERTKKNDYSRLNGLTSEPQRSIIDYNKGVINDNYK